MSRNNLFLLLVIVILPAIGCNRSPQLFPVSGRITWKGAPIEKGYVAFIAEDGKSTEAVANIVRGEYSTMATPGWKRVEIYADQSQGFDQVMQQEIRVPLVTPEYNAESKLRFEVKPQGSNPYDLVLPLAK